MLLFGAFFCGIAFLLTLFDFCSDWQRGRRGLSETVPMFASAVAMVAFLVLDKFL